MTAEELGDFLDGVLHGENVNGRLLVVEWSQQGEDRAVLVFHLQAVGNAVGGESFLVTIEKEG